MGRDRSHAGLQKAERDRDGQRGSLGGTPREDIQGIRVDAPSEKQAEPGQQLTGPRPEAGRARAADREIYRGSQQDRTKEPPESRALCSEQSGRPCRWLHGENVVSSGSRTPGLLDRPSRLCELQPVASMEGQSQEAGESVPQRVRDRPCGLIHLGSVVATGTSGNSCWRPLEGQERGLEGAAGAWDRQALFPLGVAYGLPAAH